MAHKFKLRQKVFHEESKEEFFIVMLFEDADKKPCYGLSSNTDYYSGNNKVYTCYEEKSLSKVSSWKRLIS